MSLIILILLLAGYGLGLHKWFEKAGEAGWKAWVPYYRISTWVKLTNKPKSYIFWSFVPVVNLFIYANLLGETSDSYRRYSFGEHFLAIPLGFAWLPYLGFKKEEKYNGPQGENGGYKKPEKHWTREWADAIIFAIFAAYFIRTFIFEIYMIPTSSMEGTLKVGDLLVVSKFHYGSRIPNTPIAFPLVHHSFPKWIPIIGGKKSYLEWIKLDYSRLPKLQEVKRNDMVVFNFPANDTTTLEYDSQWPYYDMVRQAEKEGSTTPRRLVREKFTVIDRPVDKRENYIKRCVAIAGDELQIKSGTLFINNEPAYQPEYLQFRYIVETDGTPLDKDFMHDLDIVEFQGTSARPNTYYVFSSENKMAELRDQSFIKSAELGFFNDEERDFLQPEFSIFPYNKGLIWNKDNFGPITIPAAGMSIEASRLNYVLYSRCIAVYENNELSYNTSTNKFVINGVETDSYTFKMNYYWMMGDNRHLSQDSRYWGFVPEDHVVGKAWFTVASFDAEVPITQFWEKIRWNRIFRGIHGNWAPTEEKYTD